MVDKPSKKDALLLAFIYIMMPIQKKDFFIALAAQNRLSKNGTPFLLMLTVYF